MELKRIFANVNSATTVITDVLCCFRHVNMSVGAIQFSFIQFSIRSFGCTTTRERDRGYMCDFSLFHSTYIYTLFFLYILFGHCCSQCSFAYYFLLLLFLLIIFLFIYTYIFVGYVTILCVN